MDDHAVASKVHQYYVPLFPPAPRPDLSEAMPALHQLFADIYPASAALTETDLTDPSFIAERARRNGRAGRSHGNRGKIADGPFHSAKESTDGQGKARQHRL